MNENNPTDEINKFVLALNLKGIELSDFSVGKGGVRYVLLKDGEELFVRRYEQRLPENYIEFLQLAKSYNIGFKK